MSRPRLRRPPLLLAAALLLASAPWPSPAFPLPPPIRLRPGFPDDDLPIALIMAKELRNPLGVSHKHHLLVAEDASTGRRVGWAQIRAVGYAGVGRTDPSRFEDDDDDAGSSGSALSRREVQPASSIEEDVNELMWQEFEDDPTAFPNGLASLPWTVEYRAASKAADDRLRRREQMLARELAARPRLWELSSVYVVPEWRRQGIGTSLVRTALERHAAERRPGRDVYAMAPAGMLSWYEGAGFEREARVPSALAVGRGAGGALAKALGVELVCVRASA